MNQKSDSAITRRTVLHGLGATIALPWLEAMTGTAHGAAPPAARKNPPRLACFYVPGAIGRHGWFPKDTGFKYTLAPSHRPLEKFRDQFTVLTNLRHIEGQISGHVHPYNWLTGHNINLVPGTITNTVSMDQVAAKHLGPTWLPSLALSFHSGVGAATLSRNSMGVDVPAIASHRTVFDRLFPPADRAQLAEARARVALNKSVLDAAVDDVKALQSRISGADRQRLEQYTAAVREIERRLGDRDAILVAGRPGFDEKSVRTEPATKNSMREHIELMMDLIALAFQTDMTRVVTHSLGGEGGPNYDEYKAWAKEYGAPLRGAHDYHHKGGQGGPDSPDTKVIEARDRMFSACLARLMGKLAALDGPDGSVLDHTVLLLGGSQISSHSGKSFPMLLAGGRMLGLKHGQHLRFEAGRRPASDLYLTILQRLGCPVTSFKESRGPIAELLA